LDTEYNLNSANTHTVTKHKSNYLAKQYHTAFLPSNVTSCVYLMYVGIWTLVV